MKPYRCVSILFTSVILLFGCSGNLPLFQELHDGRSDLLERIEVTPGNVTLTNVTYALFTATGYYNDGSSADLTAKCEWSSDDQSVAVVTSGGYLQARSLDGTANVTARYDTLTSTAAVTIDISLVSLEITPSETTLRSSNQVYLTATGTASDGTLTDLTKTVTWNVSPFKLGRVDETGLFCASGTAGTATITATSPDGTITSGKATVTLDLTTIYVNAAFIAEAGDGTKERPFPTITQGLAQAVKIGATRINVAKGTYSEDLVISSDISLYGGYNADYSGKEWTRDATVVPLDTQIVAEGNTAILYQGGLTVSTVIDGFHIEGGRSSLNSSGTGIMCVNASPLIQNCEICGGSSQVMSYGIMLQTSSAKITNNTISGGLPGYTGGGSDNIAILAQSASNPTIDANTITGPSGGESTYRIKCESSSNAMITNNTIETTSASVASARGILAISSSPMIQGNTISAAASSAIAIRGENTSFSVTGNSIRGSIHITSGSTNPAIYANTMISGTVTATGSSTGISIRDHIITSSADANYQNHYGRSNTKIIQGAILFMGSATGTIYNNVLNNIIARDGANITVISNTIMNTNTGSALELKDSQGKICNNYISTYYSAAGYVNCIICTAASGDITISNNVICACNLDSSSISGAIGIGAKEYIEIFCIYNNLIYTTGKNPTANLRSIYLLNYLPFPTRIMNNIFLLEGGAARWGIYSETSDNPPAMIQGNMFINPTAAYWCAKDTSKNKATAEDLNGMTAYYLCNATTTSTAANWTDYLSFREGPDFFNNDFHLQSVSSSLYNKGQSPNVYAGTNYYSIHPETIASDFSGITRTLTTGQFSVGPYEYVAP